MIGEISFDLVMEEDMEFVEGAFRLPCGEWQVIIVKKSSIADVEIAPSKWSSGVAGVVIHVPQSVTLNKQFVERIAANWLGVDAWNEVRGPDSMQLR